MEIGGVHPDLVLVLVIAWTILREFETSLTWALFGGLSLDFVSGAPFGIFTLTMLIVVVVAHLSYGRFFDSGFVILIGFTFPLSVLFNFLALTFLSLLGRPVIWIDAFQAVLFPAALLNTAVMAVVFPPIYYLNQKLRPQPLTL